MSYARSHFTKRAYQIESPTEPGMHDRLTVHMLSTKVLIGDLAN